MKLILMNWKNVKTLQAPIIIYLLEAPRKIFFYLYVGRDFCELVADQTNIHAEYLQRKSGTTDANWEDTNVDEMFSCISSCHTTPPG
jgi:hypothetical protein